MSIDTTINTLTEAVTANDPLANPAVVSNLQGVIADREEEIERLSDARHADEDRITALIREKSDLELQVQQLNSAVAAQRLRAEGAERQVVSVQEAHRRDIDRIGEALLSEAEDRDWCGDYDRVIEQLNERLSVALPTRVKEHTVTVQVTYQVDVTVEAHDIEEAEDKIREAELSTSWRVSTPFLSSDIAMTGIYGHNVEVEIAD